VTPASPAPDGKPWPHRRHFRVTYRDLDVLGHLNHAVYFPFMETLRCEYYLSLRDRPEDVRALDIIVAEAACRYLAPAGYNAEFVGEIAPGRGGVGRTSFVLLYRFRHPTEARVYARGRTAIVAYDYERGAKKPVTPELRAALERDAVDAGAEGW
jgi:acyl-CoA thioester hydrolase